MVLVNTSCFDEVILIEIVISGSQFITKFDQIFIIFYFIVFILFYGFDSR